MQGGGLVFAGQRDDAFYGDIGAIFDLLAIRKGTGNTGGGKDFFAGYAVHSLALQIPISQLDDADHTIGIWTSVDRQQVQVRHETVKKRVRVRVDGRTVTKTVTVRTAVASNEWVQVSRLGNPLVNEVIIPTERKDEWNRGTPAQDSRYEAFYRTPILAAVMNTLYPGVINAPPNNRDDLVAVLLTGVPDLNNTGPKLADVLRLNMSIPPPDRSAAATASASSAGTPPASRTGAGSEDDVVDIAEQAVAGFLKGNPVAKAIGDGVNSGDRPFLAAFPYQADPPSGFDNAKGRQRP